MVGGGWWCGGGGCHVPLRASHVLIRSRQMCSIWGRNGMVYPSGLQGLLNDFSLLWSFGAGGWGPPSRSYTCSHTSPCVKENTAHILSSSYTCYQLFHWKVWHRGKQLSFHTRRSVPARFTVHIISRPNKHLLCSNTFEITSVCALSDNTVMTAVIITFAYTYGFHTGKSNIFIFDPSLNTSVHVYPTKYEHMGIKKQSHIYIYIYRHIHAGTHTHTHVTFFL